ncbi:MAG: ATP-binding cassette domain-containing protein [Gemmatimonadetes bacterium]|uniref:ATP-binding cassette domain-containing protein n=1 Tax=Candidatus Kutchimonas denitrificans TaxID=3056748 RepID=A0AAE5CC81_9BACT|nr:ATP-binding cassette domain-containing protein [Gemmatimonadota bacterium]NIR75345.1 ATP-binding cassette domain-containing protein [Candidatus Kutchimonas denitrificans]NIS00977.1 ATP-binding cassette domain-containing protein [Gemmatimonadota bacterium]NIT66604.1 ATP-binding cassette domain-containing protein [Gemmatimonadota bacterium]NIU53174.1 ATP-binding cassette domain-containing protein [Gemmatimonadota bacterium]
MIDTVLYRLSRVSMKRAGRSALKDVELDLRVSELTVLVGPSGAGKTSLLRLLNRLDSPTSGSILYDGRPIESYSVLDLRRRVGFVFQKPVMFPGTVRGNMERAARIVGLAAGEIEERMREAMETAELPLNLLDRDGSELSLGQQQRANLARCLMTGPETLLLDEPTSALDPETSDRLLRTIRKLCRERGHTVIMATHRVGEAAAVGDRLVSIREGAVADPELDPATLARALEQGVDRDLPPST